MKKILWLSIAAYIILWSALSFWKYDQLLYNGLDLAIYSNVFWNTSHGNWFASSIHPPSYLGDHFEPLILPLSLLYRLWPDARMLLLFQSIALALATIPLYAITSLLSRRGDGERGAPSSPSTPSLSRGMRSDGAASRQDPKPWLPLLVTALWLLNPFVHNANLFEFHMLSFAPLFLFSMYYFYLRRRFWPFLLFTFLSLAVREDIALLVAAFGILFFIDRLKKGANLPPSLPPTLAEVSMEDSSSAGEGSPVSLDADAAALLTGGASTAEHDDLPRHRSVSPAREVVESPYHFMAGPRATAFTLTAIALSMLWLLLSFSLISRFSPEGSYKFLAYYSWIQTNPISGFFGHLAKPTVLAMIVGLLIPFLFLPLLRPRFLLLALPPFLQFALTSGGGGSVVLQTHYALLFLPALFLGTIDVIASRMGDTSWEWHRRGVTREGGPPSSARNEVRTSDGGAAGQDPEEKYKSNPLAGPPLVISWSITLGSILLTTATLYSTLTLGPLLPALKKIFIASLNQQVLQTKKEFLARIPKETPIATTYEFLTPLANRQTIASLHYAFLGRKQYSDTPYELPQEIEAVLIDFDDFKTYQLQFAHNPFYSRFYQDGNDRIRQLIRERRLAPTKTKGGIALFTPSKTESLAELTATGNISQTESILAQMLVPEAQGGLELDGIRSIIRIID